MRSTNAPFDSSQRADEIHDISPRSFRFVLALLIGLGVLAVAGIL